MKYSSLDQLESLVKDQNPVSYGSSKLAKAVLDDCWPGLRYLAKRVPPTAIIEGRKGHYDLSSWLGEAPPMVEHADFRSEQIIGLIEERFLEIKEQAYAESQRHLIGWLLNFAAQQDLGPLFETCTDASGNNEYTPIAWSKLPDWHMPDHLKGEG